ncbi:hypothetical protein SO802_026202 [Lithocarpus litseifolius]|uniref:Uncharacterized protein n=1 Tax=Lithocarpus litseifolius TaxID=425828 RepID=A0AAW2C1J0_9ROSI
MAESPSSTRKTNPQKAPMETDMTAVKQLMQLIDIDTTTTTTNNNKRKKPETEEEVDERRSETTSSVKIEESSGDEGEEYWPNKQKYRSLASIYMATKPMNNDSWCPNVTTKEGFVSPDMAMDARTVFSPSFETG